jgi:hypothetical protein
MPSENNRCSHCETLDKLNEIHGAKIEANCQAVKTKVGMKEFKVIILAIAGLVTSAFGYTFLESKTASAALDRHSSYAQAQCEAIKAKILTNSESSARLEIIFGTIQKSLEDIKQSQREFQRDIFNTVNKNRGDIEKMIWERENNR